MPAEAQAVRQLFDAVAPHYDRLNDLLSLGLHRLWKREMVQRLAPVAGEQWLDLCCGTGDLALVLAERLRRGGAVLAVDAAAAPLQQARRRHLEPARARPPAAAAPPTHSGARLVATCESSVKSG